MNWKVSQQLLVTYLPPYMDVHPSLLLAKPVKFLFLGVIYMIVAKGSSFSSCTIFTGNPGTN